MGPSGPRSDIEHRLHGQADRVVSSRCGQFQETLPAERRRTTAHYRGNALAHDMAIQQIGRRAEIGDRFRPFGWWPTGDPLAQGLTGDIEDLRSLGLHESPEAKEPFERSRSEAAVECIGQGAQASRISLEVVQDFLQ